MMFRLLPFALLVLPLVSVAEFTPTAPGPGDKFTEGGDCVVEWIASDSGHWKQTNIQLMTGPNNPMTHLTTVGTVDGSDPSTTSFTFKCPQVTVHAPIYFLQFTTSDTANVTWTGRWTIVDASGKVDAPPNATQPDGSQIPWGNGALVNGGSPPPSTAPPGQLDGSKGPVDIDTASLSSTGSSSSVSGTLSGPPIVATPSTPSTSSISTPSGITTVSTPLSTNNPAASTGNSNSTNAGNDTGSATAFSVPSLMTLVAISLGYFMI